MQSIDDLNNAMIRDDTDDLFLFLLFAVYADEWCDKPKTVNCTTVKER